MLINHTLGSYGAERRHRRPRDLEDLKNSEPVRPSTGAARGRIRLPSCVGNQSSALIDRAPLALNYECAANVRTSSLLLDTPQRHSSQPRSALLPQRQKYRLLSTSTERCLWLSLHTSHSALVKGKYSKCFSLWLRVPHESFPVHSSKRVLLEAEQIQAEGQSLSLLESFL